MEKTMNEKIREYLLQMVNAIRADDFELSGLNKEEVLAYLERQKEQKPLTTEETELNSIAFLEQMGYTCIPPRKEQEADLEKEIEKYCRIYYNCKYPDQIQNGKCSSIMPHIVEAARHFFELGRARKEEQ